MKGENIRYCYWIDESGLVCNRRFISGHALISHLYRVHIKDFPPKTPFVGKINYDLIQADVDGSDKRKIHI